MTISLRCASNKNLKSMALNMESHWSAIMALRSMYELSSDSSSATSRCSSVTCVSAHCIHTRHSVNLAAEAASRLSAFSRSSASFMHDCRCSRKSW